MGAPGNVVTGPHAPSDDVTYRSSPNCPRPTAVQSPAAAQLTPYSESRSAPDDTIRCQLPHTPFVSDANAPKFATGSAYATIPTAVHSPGAAQLTANGSPCSAG